MVPPFTAGSNLKTRGEYLSGVSLDPALPQLSFRAFNAQLECASSYKPCGGLNVQAYFLSHVSEFPDHMYSLLRALFLTFDEEWLQHTQAVESNATASS